MREPSGRFPIRPGNAHNCVTMAYRQHATNVAGGTYAKPADFCHFHASWSLAKQSGIGQWRKTSTKSGHGVYVMIF